MKTINDIQDVQKVFCINLAVSDLFMGIYMLFLAIADTYYGDEFYQYSDYWRVSIPCKFANFFSLLSNETTLLLITFITIDRYLCLTFPFSTNHFQKFSATIVSIAVWIFTVPLSLVSSIFADPDFNFYVLSDACIGLPLKKRPISYEVSSSHMIDHTVDYTFEIPTATGSKSSWYFSIVLFIGFNSFLVILITILYIITFFNVRKSKRAAQNSPNIKAEVKLALRMTGVVVTNCMCWLPVIILGILSQANVSISLDAYLWSVAFILPINASLNPCVYTLYQLLIDH